MNRLYFLHLKMIFSHKLTLLIFIFMSFLLLVIVSQLVINEEEKSSIPVGIANLDESETTRELIKSLNTVPTFLVYEENEENLKRLLSKDKIAAYFVIHKGYEDSIEKGNTKGLITMYYAQGNEKYKILSDIFAGEMLYSICLYKGYNLYQALDWDNVKITGNKAKNDTTMKKLSREEYISYTNSLTEKEDFDFAFDISFISVSKGEGRELKLDNTLLYQQITVGIIGILYAFIAMIMMNAFVAEKENALHRRINISLLSFWRKDLNQLAPVLTLEGILGISFLFILTGKIEDYTMLKGSILFILMLLYTLIVSLTFLLLSKIVNNTGRYQLIGTALILCMGAAGYLYLLSGIINSKILNISKIIPNSWFIRGFTDIILCKSLQDISLESFAYFLVTALGLLIINGITGLKQK